MKALKFLSKLLLAVSALGIASCVKSALEKDPTSSDGVAKSLASVTMQCYWMENHSGNYNWVPAPYTVKSKQECYELDSCNGGLRKSGGGCYKWAKSSDSPREPWKEEPKYLVYPKGVKKLIASYPDHIIGYKNDSLIFNDQSTLVYDDHKKRSWLQLLTNPDIKDQFYYPYPTTFSPQKPFVDPGRINNQPFFKKIYGGTKEEVEKNLVTIPWVPSFKTGETVTVTRINGIAEKLKAISSELEKYPELKDYVTHIGGGFNWRYIHGTHKLSLHSFGIAIDISVSKSNYWQWDCKCTNEDNRNLKYNNRISHIIVNIFEKYGFVWGGKWYHYDTMHFEYRPELLLNRQTKNHYDNLEFEVKHPVHKKVAPYVIIDNS